MAKKESTQKNYRAHDEWMAFVFTPYNYDNGPAGGWFDFVGARNTIEDAREAVEDKSEQGENYQIVDVGSLAIVEEGEVSSRGAITFEELDRRAKVLEQSMALANINAAKQWRGQPEVMRYGPHEDDEVNGRKEWRLDPNTIEIGLRIIAMRKSAQCFGYFAAMVGRRQGTLEEAGSPRAADRDHPGLLQ